jgi:hypothetical protein
MTLEGGNRRHGALLSCIIEAHKETAMSLYRQPAEPAPESQPSVFAKYRDKHVRPEFEPEPKPQPKRLRDRIDWDSDTGGRVMGLYVLGLIVTAGYWLPYVIEHPLVGLAGIGGYFVLGCIFTMIDIYMVES